MAEAPTEHEPPDLDEVKFARSVAFWIIATLPVALVVITLAVWLMIDADLGKALTISVWPAILVGVFGGGFVGVVRGHSH